MSEKNFRKRTRDGFRSVVPPPDSFVAQIENLAGEGMPDTFWCVKGKCGWLELKWLESFPKRETTVVRIAHFRDCQRAWLHDYAMAGGTCHVWLKVGDEHFLLDGLEASMFLGRGEDGWREKDIRAKALISFPRQINWKDFVECLTKK